MEKNQRSPKQSSERTACRKAATEIANRSHSQAVYYKRDGKWFAEPSLTFIDRTVEDPGFVLTCKGLTTIDARELKTPRATRRVCLASAIEHANRIKGICVVYSIAGEGWFWGENAGVDLNRFAPVLKQVLYVHPVNN